MTASSDAVQQIVDGFTGKIAAQLDGSRLDGPIRLDPTRSYVIIPLKDKGPIHVPVQGKIDESGVQSVIHQIRLVPSLKSLLV